MMKCPRCGNRDPHLIGQLNGRYYCRACIQFNRQFLDEQHFDKPQIQTVHETVTYHLDFVLSTQQQKISDQLILNYERGINTSVMAVCGSGKTEMTYAVIAKVINRGGRVCFAIPRRALCVELYERIKAHFSGISIGLFYGGCHLHYDAPLIVCTTHQLYRFVDNPFELVLLDEADAFPYYKDRVLQAILKSCVKRCCIKMSATLCDDDQKDGEILIMNRRYHGANLPLPHILLVPRRYWLSLIKKKINQMIKEQKRILIYVPLIADVPQYVQLLRPWFRVKGVSSHSSGINEAVSMLRDDQIDVLVTTTILERGMTVENVQVFVMNASHKIYDERTLMQIAGRVGRSVNFPSGDIYFIDQCFSKEMKSCIATINSLNQDTV